MMNEKKQKRLCIITGCLLALIFILLIFSLHNIDPLHTEWVTQGGGDNLQHYIGWRFFRNNGWNRYLLFMKNLNYPVGTSVIVTDSNPLFSLFFKLFDRFLPPVFQFNGVWILLSYLLLAFFAAEIGWRLTHKVSLGICSAILAFLNPVILQRALIHDTLTAHWLILAAVWLFLNENRSWNAAGWFFLAVTTLLIHIYFLPMIAFILILQMIRMIMKKRTFIQIIAVPGVFIAALVLGYFLLGYSYILPQSGSYGELSMNLNAFFNPDAVLAILPARPIQSLQYEGFNYYGAGMLLLLFFALMIGRRRFLSALLPYLIPALGLLMIAASNKAYFDLTPVYQFALPEKISSILSVFRSSGRLVWPLYYLGLFLSLSILGKQKERSKWIEGIIFFCVLVQVFDLKGFFAESAFRFRNPENILPALPQNLESKIPPDSEHLYCSDGDAKSLDSFALYAADHHMTFNKSANARSIRHIFGGDELDIRELTCQQLQSGSVYIYLSEEDLPAGIDQCENVVIERVDELVIVIR